MPVTAAESNEQPAEHEIMRISAGTRSPLLILTMSPGRIPVASMFTHGRPLLLTCEDWGTTCLYCSIDLVAIKQGSKQHNQAGALSGGGMVLSLFEERFFFVTATGMPSCVVSSCFISASRGILCISELSSSKGFPSCSPIVGLCRRTLDYDYKDIISSFCIVSVRPLREMDLAICALAETRGSQVVLWRQTLMLTTAR